MATEVQIALQPQAGQDPAAALAAAAAKLARSSLATLIQQAGQPITGKVIVPQANLPAGFVQLAVADQVLTLKLSTPLPAGTPVRIDVQPSANGQPTVTVQPLPRAAVAQQPAMQAQPQLPPLPQPVPTPRQATPQSQPLSAAPAAASPAPSASPSPTPAATQASTLAPASMQQPAPTGSQPMAPIAQQTTPPTPATTPNAPISTPATPAPATASAPATAPVVTTTIAAPAIAPPPTNAIAQTAPPVPAPTTTAAPAQQPTVSATQSTAPSPPPQQITPSLPQPTAPAPAQPPTPTPQMATPASATAPAPIPSAAPSAPLPATSVPASPSAPPPVLMQRLTQAFAPPGQPASPAPAAAPQAQLAMMATTQAAAQQQSAAPLLQALAVALPALPKEVADAATKVLANRVSLDRGAPAGEALKQAVLKSGVFLEPPRAGAQPDIRQALTQLRGTLLAWLGDDIAPVAAVTRRPPPPARGATPRAQGPELLPPSVEGGAKEAGKSLLGQTEGALSRLKLLQLTSQPVDAVRPSAAPLAAPTEWNLEIPMMLGRELAMAQIQIQRDGKSKGEVRDRSWRLRFALNLSVVGEVGAQVTMSGTRAAVALWADEPQTAETLEAMLPELGPALTAKGLELTSLVVRRGAPRDESQPVGRLMDSRR